MTADPQRDSALAAAIWAIATLEELVSSCGVFAAQSSAQAMTATDSVNWFATVGRAAGEITKLKRAIELPPEAPKHQPSQRTRKLLDEIHQSITKAIAAAWCSAALRPLIDPLLMLKRDIIEFELSQGAR